ncbi:TPA: hypothetical protein HA253_00930, partial [Candidatus Woesearchaeota archaeon]|nr:hypothetical protein [Candidatus Woesearchaeota archaeon]
RKGKAKTQEASSSLRLNRQQLAISEQDHRELDELRKQKRELSAKEDELISMELELKKYEKELQSRYRVGADRESTEVELQKSRVRLLRLEQELTEK